MTVCSLKLDRVLTAVEHRRGKPTVIVESLLGWDVCILRVCFVRAALAVVGRCVCSWCRNGVARPIFESVKGHARRSFGDTREEQASVSYGLVSNAIV
jgi:hypothetical protein